jgi:type III pantothenate kinase
MLHVAAGIYHNLITFVAGMNIVIDIGNSRIKFARFSDGGLVEQFAKDEFGLDWFSLWLDDYPEADKCILSAVGKVEESWKDYLQKRFGYFIFFDASTPVPVVNLYKTPETLGKDRLAGVIGANNIFPGRAVLVIDYGTAITFDYLSSAGEYQGGNISPGLQTRFRALNHFTSGLPLVRPEPLFLLSGIDTESAIRAGVMKGIVYETEGYVIRFREENEQGVVVLTGGDAGYFAGWIKPPIFVDHDLVINGLNTILEYNFNSYSAQ